MIVFAIANQRSLSSTRTGRREQKGMLKSSVAFQNNETPHRKFQHFLVAHFRDFQQRTSLILFYTSLTLLNSSNSINRNHRHVFLVPSRFFWCDLTDMILSKNLCKARGKTPSSTTQKSYSELSVNNIFIIKIFTNIKVCSFFKNKEKIR